MGLLERIATVIESNINAMISESEDPEKMLNQLIRDMHKQYREAHKQVQLAIADEKRINKEYIKERGKANDWQRKAILALKENREDLAREALVRKNEYATGANTYLEQLEKQSAMVQQLKQSLLQLNRKIEEARRKKNLLVARHKRAKAQKKITTTMSRMGDDSSFEAFDRMEDKIEQLEAEADAAVELEALEGSTTLEAEFAALEAEGGVENELLALKAELGIPVPELEGIDIDIEALPDPDELEALPDDTEILEADKEITSDDAEAEGETDKG
ncbi:MAG: PspA/IM30 family protein [bacterium]|nr:PspA/IM30 family protein [bacterium]